MFLRQKFPVRLLGQVSTAYKTCISRKILGIVMTDMPIVYSVSSSLPEPILTLSTITLAPQWITTFKTASGTQQCVAVTRLLADHPQSLFVQG